MSHANPLDQCRRTALRAWVAPLLVALLLLAQAVAVTHQYDSAAHHANGQPCSVCLSTASLGAAAPATLLALEFAMPLPLFAAAAVVVFFSAVPTRRYARGPPAVSFTF